MRTPNFALPSVVFQNETLICFAVIDMLDLVIYEKTGRLPNIEIGFWDENYKRWIKEDLPSSIAFRPSANDVKNLIIAGFLIFFIVVVLFNLEIVLNTK